MIEQFPSAGWYRRQDSRVIPNSYGMYGEFGTVNVEQIRQLEEEQAARQQKRLERELADNMLGEYLSQAAETIKANPHLETEIVQYLNHQVTVAKDLGYGVYDELVTFQTETVYRRPKITKEQIAFLDSEEGQKAAKRLQYELFGGLFEKAFAEISNTGHKLKWRWFRGGTPCNLYPAYSQGVGPAPMLDYLFPKSENITPETVQAMIRCRSVNTLEFDVDSEPNPFDIDYGDLEVLNWCTGNYVVEKQRLDND